MSYHYDEKEDRIASLEASLNQCWTTRAAVNAERDALRAVLREILEEVNSSTSRLPRSLIERAEKLLGGAE